MKTYTPRELRSAIVLAVLLTVIVMLALMDPSCQPRTGLPQSGPLRSNRFSR
jgi:hypothetical protein